MYFQFHGLLLGIGINNNVLPFGAVIKVIIERYGREYDKDKMAPKGRPTNKKMKVSKICIIISNESLRSPKWDRKVTSDMHINLYSYGIDMIL